MPTWLFVISVIVAFLLGWGSGRGFPGCEDE